MKKLIVIVILLLGIMMPVHAAAIEAPQVPNDVQQLMPHQQDNFGQALWSIIKETFSMISPDLAHSTAVCVGVIAAVILVSIMKSFSGVSASVVQICESVVIACILFADTSTFVSLGDQTVKQLSEYGKSLLPVMTAAMAAQGGVAGSGAIYTATAIFDGVLCTLISELLLPFVYVMLVLSVSASAIGIQTFQKLRDLVKWFMSWCLKTVMYVFTGYIGITGVISGTADQSMLKATKLTISGMVPVVGGILSDASEAVLVGAGVVKNSAGIYGILAIVCMFLGPFLRIGIHYILLKLTTAVCGIFAEKTTTDLIGDFSSAMGLLLAMTGSICMLLMISTVCFMKGVS